jgi:hypothetical protein
MNWTELPQQVMCSLSPYNILEVVGALTETWIWTKSCLDHYLEYSWSIYVTFTPKYSLYIPNGSLSWQWHKTHFITSTRIWIPGCPFKKSEDPAQKTINYFRLWLKSHKRVIMRCANGTARAENVLISR